MFVKTNLFYNSNYAQYAIFAREISHFKLISDSENIFMKKILVISHSLLFDSFQSQTFLKFNGATALLAIPNVGIETSIGAKTTLVLMLWHLSGNLLMGIIQ